MKKQKRLQVLIGARYVYRKGKLKRIGPPATKCTCGQGWTLCDYCFERN